MARILPFVPPRIVHLLIKRLLVTWQHPDEAIFEDGLNPGSDLRKVLIERRKIGE
jgi:hypothetical protein